jgi:cytidylate kinase
MRLPRAVTVDGPAGAGKSSVCFAVARDLGYLFVDTGAFYRMVTLVAVEADQINADESAILALATQHQFDLSPQLQPDGRQYTALLDRRDVTATIRTPQVEANVSRIAAMPRVRDLVNDLQRDVAERQRVIMAGRDIGTVVMPTADLKIYLDATPEARGLRRYQQILASGKTADLNQITADLRARDSYDSSRATAPLRRAEDAVYVDSSNLSIDQVIDRFKQLITEWETTDQPIREG